MRRKYEAEMNEVGGRKKQRGRGGSGQSPAVLTSPVATSSLLSSYSDFHHRPG